VKLYPPAMGNGVAESKTMERTCGRWARILMVWGVVAPWGLGRPLAGTHEHTGLHHNFF